MSAPSGTTGKPPSAPHPPLESYYRGEEGRRSYVRRIFDETGDDYDRIERVMAFGSGAWYRRRGLRRAGLDRGMLALDVAVGTGLVAREAASIVGDPGRVVGVDPSVGMMRAATRPHGVAVVQGVAEALPFAGGRFDFLSMGFALRHVHDLSVAFSEFARVLKPGGRLCVLEITPPSGRIPRLLVRAYMRGLVPVVAAVFGRRRESAELWRYYWDTIEACVPPQRVLDLLRDAGFDEPRRYVEVGVFSEYTARRRS